MGRRWRDGSEFGRGARRPMCREQRAQFVAKLKLGRRTKGVTQAMQRIGEIMVRMMADDGRLDPSMQTLASLAAVSRQTVVAALARLEEFGFLRRTRRLVRVGNRVEQTSNAYVLSVPTTESSFQTRVQTRVFPKRAGPGLMSLEAQRAAAIYQFHALGVPVPPEWGLT